MHALVTFVLVTSLEPEPGLVLVHELEPVPELEPVLGLEPGPELEPAEFADHMQNFPKLRNFE